MLLALLIFAAGFLAWTNGANDNFKGVASLHGSGTVGYNTAIGWATLTTLAGSLCSLLLAGQLAKKFSGRGLVPDALVGSEIFLLAVALGAGLTVLAATRFGFPISTTHALLGGLVGAGLGASAKVNFAALGMGFVLPLLLSPLVAVVISGALYFALHLLRVLFRIPKQWCLCVGAEETRVAMPAPASILALHQIAPPVVTADGSTIDQCREKYAGHFIGIDSQRVVDALHFLSAGFVSFSRGLNDAPKIAAMLLLAGAMPPSVRVLMVSITMALGGLLAARRVAETMSHKITAMNHGQGLTANLATGLLVFSASTYGLPVSTTHVAVGALGGIGLATGQAHLKVLGGIVLSWIVTLPCAAALAALVYLLLTRLPA